MYMYHECVHMEDTGQEIATGHLTFPNNLNKCPTILSLHVYHIHSTLHDRSKIIKSKQIIDLIFCSADTNLKTTKTVIYTCTSHLRQLIFHFFICLKWPSFFLSFFLFISSHHVDILFATKFGHFPNKWSKLHLIAHSYATLCYTDGI